MENKTADQIVRALSDWSNKYPRGWVYNTTKQAMDDELISIENDAKAYVNKEPEVQDIPGFEGTLDNLKEL